MQDSTTFDPGMEIQVCRGRRPREHDVVGLVHERLFQFVVKHALQYRPKSGGISPGRKCDTTRTPRPGYAFSRSQADGGNVS